jgi:hypothetical protein
MSNHKKLEIALVEWTANLKSRDRARKSVRPNFEELLQKWKDLDATFDELYDSPETGGLSLLQKAIKAHQPVSSVARNTYKTLKTLIDKTEKEFIEEWQASIEATGQEVFFEFYPATALDKDTEPKVFGSMSAREYRAQRRYAEQFPILDTTELEKRWNEQKYNLDIEDMIETVLGKDDDETNS